MLKLFTVYEYMFRADSHQLTFCYQASQPRIKTILRSHLLNLIVPFTPNHF